MTFQKHYNDAIRFIIGFTAVAAIYAAQPGELGKEILIASGSKPDIASDAKGNPHIVYESGGILYVKGNGISGQFSECSVLKPIAC